MADLLLRNIDPSIIKKYDTLAERKGISRNTLLKNLFEEYILLKEREVETNEYKNLINTMLIQLKINTKAVERNTEFLDSLLD